MKKVLTVLFLVCSLSIFSLPQGRSASYRGTLSVMQSDNADSTGAYSFFVDHDGTSDEILLEDTPDEGFQTGDQVEATGTQLPNGKLFHGHISRTTSASPIPQVSGNITTLVMLCNFSDNAVQPITLTQAATVMSAASNWDIENSYETAWLTSNVVGYFTLAETMAQASTTNIESLCNSAAQGAGINLSSYSHYVYVFPRLPQFTWWGLAEIGGTHVWIQLQIATFAQHVVEHEMGHNFGLYHAHSLNCGTVSDCTAGTLTEYGDPFDVMGVSTYNNPHYNAAHKEQIGWLGGGGTPNISTISTTGTYTLDPIEDNTTPSALHGIKIVDTVCTGCYYYLEFRQPQGFDSFLASNANVINGLLVHRFIPSSYNTNDLLDMTPNNGGFNDAALLVNQTYTTKDGTTITPTSVNSTAATVSIVFNAPPPPPPAPNSISCTSTPGAGTYSRNDTSQVTVAVIDGASAPVAGASIVQTITKANSSIVKQSCSTDSAGNAVCSYKIKRNDPTGSWTVSDGVTFGSLTATCTSSFTVN